MDMVRQGKPVKCCVLKARQLGLSTISEGLIFHKTIFTRAVNSLIVAQDPGQSTYLFDMFLRAYDNLPWWMRPEKLFRSKGKYMVFDTAEPARDGLRSQIMVESANKLTGVSVGKTVRACHMCLTENNPVSIGDGFMKSIADTKPGDEIYGERDWVTVVATAVREAEEKGYRITPWCNSAFPIEGTWNHEVKTARIYRK